MSASTAEGNIEFSTTRINRLLRPLRNRCRSLATFNLSATWHGQSTARATYSSRTTRLAQVCYSNGESDIPPLTILQPPQSFGLRIHLDKTCVLNLELSQKLYDVRDSFRDVLRKTATRSSAMPVRDKRSVMSLSTMCSIVVGENVEPELDANISDGPDHEELTDTINHVYEAVPLQYRRCAVVTHALDLILRICPHHATLLSILLDICLAYNVVHQSNTLLRALLRVAVSPVSISRSVPPLSHLAHSEYLTDLRKKWNTEGQLDVAFIRILVEVLAEVSSPEAWSCKAVNKLAHDICNKELPCFMYMLGGLVECLADVQSNLVVQRKRKNRLVNRIGCTQRESTSLTDRLLQWLKLALDCSFASHRLSEATTLDGEGFQSVLDFLQLAYSSGIHIHAAPLDDASAARRELANAVACLATRCISHSFASTAELGPILDLLREVTPVPSTYSNLIADIFAPTAEYYSFAISFDNCKDLVRAHARRLRSYHLLHLEASFWASALRHIELFDGGRLHAIRENHKDIRDYRRELINLVDDAERRCFGFSAMDESFVDGMAEYGPSDLAWDRQGDDIRSIQTTLGIQVEMAALEREWEWEAMVGCWIRKSPCRSAAKRPKLVRDHIPRFSRRLLARSIRKQDDIDHPGCVTSERLITSSCSSEAHVLDISCSTSEKHVSELPPEDVGLSLGVESVPESNFTTLLADALCNRTVLHHSYPAKAFMPDVVTSSQGSPRTTPSKSFAATGEDDDGAAFDRTIPSDDSLDLFACGPSSPDL